MPPSVASNHRAKTRHTNRRTALDKTKMKGKAHEAVGEAREHIGRATGNDKMEAKGHAQEMKGKVQSRAGGVKEAVKDKLD